MKISKEIEKIFSLKMILFFIFSFLIETAITVLLLLIGTKYVFLSIALMIITLMLIEQLPYIKLDLLRREVIIMYETRHNEKEGTVSIDSIKNVSIEIIDKQTAQSYNQKQLFGFSKYLVFDIKNDEKRLMNVSTFTKKQMHYVLVKLLTAIEQKNLA
jgi:hypothetical protein